MQRSLPEQPHAGRGPQEHGRPLLLRLRDHGQRLLQAAPQALASLRRVTGVGGDPWP